MITKSQIVDIKSLTNKDFRYDFSLFLAEGEKVAQEVCFSNFFVKGIYYIKEKVSAKTAEHINKMKQRQGCDVFEVSDKEMSRISALKTHTPILMVVRMPKMKFTHSGGKLIIALDNVQDPGNMGTIIRIADWFGIHDILCSENCADVFNPKVVQATMGAITRVRVHYVPLYDTLKMLASAGEAIFGTFLEGDIIYSSGVSGASGVIVMGNEGKGISTEIVSLVTRKLFIPPFPVDEPSSESLNVAVATAVVCNEFRRK